MKKAIIAIYLMVLCLIFTSCYNGEFYDASETPGSSLDNPLYLEEVTTIGFVWLDQTTLTASMLNQTSTSAWTTIDFSDNTSTNAIAVIVEVVIGVDTVGTSYSHVTMRKKGTSSAVNPRSVMFLSECTAGDYKYTQFILGLDENQRAEYIVGVGPSWQVDAYIYTLGYIE